MARDRSQGARRACPSPRRLSRHAPAAVIDVPLARQPSVKGNRTLVAAGCAFRWRGLREASGSPLGKSTLLELSSAGSSPTFVERALPCACLVPDLAFDGA